VEVCENLIVEDFATHSLDTSGQFKELEINFRIEAIFEANRSDLNFVHLIHF